MAKLRELLSKYPFLMNRGFWVSLASLLYLMLNSLGVIQISEDEWSRIVEGALNGLAAALVFFGIRGDVTKGKWYHD